VLADALTAPMLEFLVWVARCPRTYADVIEAWGSHCPRFTVWEDACAAGLVEIENRHGVPMTEASIRLTQRGVASLPD
jgi:hypothetical protein